MHVCCTSQCAEPLHLTDGGCRSTQHADMSDPAKHADVYAWLCMAWANAGCMGRRADHGCHAWAGTRCMAVARFGALSLIHRGIVGLTFCHCYAKQAEVCGKESCIRGYWRVLGECQVGSDEFCKENNSTVLLGSVTRALSPAGCESHACLRLECVFPVVLVCMQGARCTREKWRA